jgi:AcrR family transcriptional regulator
VNGIYFLTAMNTTAEPTPLPRERRRQKNLQRILEGAMDAIVTGGFDALSMNKLAATLDYTPGALYRYFPSKDALVTALVAEVIDEIGRELDVVGAARDGAPLARVVACAEVWRRFAVTAPNRFALVSMLLAAPRLIVTDEAQVARSLAGLLAAVRPVAEALAAAADAGALHGGDAIERSFLLFSGATGVLLLRKQSPRAPGLLDLDRLFAAMLRALLTGWGAAPTDLERALNPAGDPPRSTP